MTNVVHFCVILNSTKYMINYVVLTWPITICNSSLHFMKLQYCLSVIIQSKTLQAITKLTGLLNQLSRYFHWIPCSFLTCAVSSRLFTRYIANNFRSAYLTSFCNSRHCWHTLELENLQKIGPEHHKIKETCARCLEKQANKKYSLSHDNHWDQL